MTGSRRGPVPLRLLVFAALALATEAGAQDDARPVRVFEMRAAPVAAPRYGKGPISALTPELQEQMSRAHALIEATSYDEARATLIAALAKAPHHPVILVQLAEVHRGKRAWKALEQLARAERAHAQDSLLLADDLVLALRRQGRHREAAQAVLETWISAPVEAEWAGAQMESLSTTDPKNVRELVRRAAQSLPQRPDLVRGAARVEWRLGDTAVALRLLDDADAHYKGAPLRWAFAEELVSAGNARDSSGAIEVLLDLGSDKDRDLNYRLVAGRRAWELMTRRQETRGGAPRIARALRDVPADRWTGSLLIEVMRGLREGGNTAEARELMKSLGERGDKLPEVALERVLNDLRDGPPERVLPALAPMASASAEGAFRYAEALFFSGQTDSALAWYERAAHEPGSAHAGAALERMYLIEDGKAQAGLALYGRLAYEQWRGDTKKALVLADSLYRSLDRGALWAQTAILLASLRESTGEGKAALEPLLAVVQALPADRAAPLACQRAGDVLRIWHKDEARALAQYEECLARYPKAWNAPEVRRTVDQLRRERRF